MTDRQILRAVAEGWSKTDIAREFGLPSTELEARVRALLTHLARTDAEPRRFDACDRRTPAINRRRSLPHLG